MRSADTRYKTARCALPRTLALLTSIKYMQHGHPEAEHPRRSRGRVTKSKTGRLASALALPPLPPAAALAVAPAGSSVALAHFVFVFANVVYAEGAFQ